MSALVDSHRRELLTAAIAEGAWLQVLKPSATSCHRDRATSAC